LKKSVPIERYRNTGSPHTVSHSFLVLFSIRKQMSRYNMGVNKSPPTAVLARKIRFNTSV